MTNGISITYECKRVLLRINKCINENILFYDVFLGYHLCLIIFNKNNIPPITMDMGSVRQKNARS